MLLLYLLLLLHNSQAMDGCPGGAGLFWRCGDICTSALSSFGLTSQNCTCGSSTFGHNDGKWCCGTNCTGGCTKWKEGSKEGDNPLKCAEWSPAICTTGLTLNLTEACNGKCNYYGKDASRNGVVIRSYVLSCANAKTCIKEAEGTPDTLVGVPYVRNYTPTICTGNPTCEGELDWCREEKRKEEECTGGFSRCLRTGSNKKVGNEKKSIPGQCIQAKKVKDEEIDCLDRSDEDPFQEEINATGKEIIIDTARLKSCTAVTGDRGLECGQTESNCIPFVMWCLGAGSQQDCPVLGPGIYTSHPVLCSNTTFWRQHSCGDGSIRCQGGNSGQCVLDLTWGFHKAKGPVQSIGQSASQIMSCLDGSDKYRLIKQPAEAEESVLQTSQKDHNENSNDGERSINGDHHEEDSNLTEVEKELKKKLKEVTQRVAERERKVFDQDEKLKMWETLPSSIDSIGPAKELSTATTAVDVLANYFQVFLNTLGIALHEGFKGEEDKARYRKDSATGLWMVAVTEKTCEDGDGFVCKVRICHVHDNMIVKPYVY